MQRRRFVAGEPVCHAARFRCFLGWVDGILVGTAAVDRWALSCRRRLGRRNGGKCSGGCGLVCSCPADKRWVGPEQFGVVGGWLHPCSARYDGSCGWPAIACCWAGVLIPGEEGPV